MKLEFYGAADRVTGSCHIIHINGQKILFDCGLIQGSRNARELNYADFPFSVKSIDAVVLSHAHIDHSGRLPLLVRRGYKGKIYAQNATRDVAGILLQDSARIQQEDAKNENRWRAKHDKPSIEPLYTVSDALLCLESFEGLKYREKHEIAKGVCIRFQDAGHIIGSACVEIWLKEGDVERKVVFSGDLGQYGKPILNDPAVITKADLVLIESTYGNRLHRDRSHTIDEIGEIILRAGEDQGNILIPAFALGRSQEILYELGTHFSEWGLEQWQIYLNSPMAIATSRVYWDYPQHYDDEASRLRKVVQSLPVMKNLHFTESVPESKALNEIKHHAILIAGSGMMSGGRILHHLKHNLARSECHLIIVGYQGRGTLGRLLIDGVEEIKIHGKIYPVNIQIHTVGGMSAHGDRKDLLRWLGQFEPRPHVALVHGEPQTREIFSEAIQHTLGLNTTMGHIGDVIDIAEL
ncbi:MAG: MBL fold metallo-hydrolase [Proteobacteria bacterium]|nr:MBL fold metallo-hydrolase [Pseudomonadota bacterium]